MLFTNFMFLIFLSCLIAVSGCSSSSNGNKSQKIIEADTIKFRNTASIHQNCIMVGKFVDSSDPAHFANLSKEKLGRKSIYGQLAPLGYKDIEIAVVDEVLKKHGSLHFFNALEELNCDFYVTGEIIKFSNKFLLTYSVTEIVMRLDLFNDKGELVWSELKNGKSDAGAIPFTPISALTGIFFASKNRKEEIAVQLVGSVSRKLVEQLDQFLDKIDRGPQLSSGTAKSTEEAHVYSVLDLRLAIELNDFDGAKMITNQLLVQDSENSEFLFLAGKAQMQKGEFEVAKEFFLKAIQIDASQSDYYNGLGITSLRLGNDLEALTNFEKALSINKKSVSAHVGLALTSEKNGLIKQSGEHFYRAGLYSISISDYPSAVYALSELKRLALEKNSLLQKAKDLEAVIKFNRNMMLH
ncbi:hypothetical protein OA861_01100 [Pseudomonadota bacterium]|nr:hypothetical protein [Pseudomonadota bacterium]